MKEIEKTGRLNFWSRPRVLPPMRIIRKPSSIRFSSDSLPDDPEWTRMQFHKSIGTNYEKKSKKWAASIFAPDLVYYPLRGLFRNRVPFVSAPIHFRTTPNGHECNFINPYGQILERNPKNGSPQFLLRTTCTTPYKDYSETEFHSFQLRFTPGRPRMDADAIS